MRLKNERVECGGLVGKNSTLLLWNIVEFDFVVEGFAVYA